MTITAAVFILAGVMTACCLVSLWLVCRAIGRRDKAMATVLSRHAGDISLRVGQGETRIIARVDGDLTDMSARLEGFSDAVMALLMPRAERRETGVPPVP